MDDWELLKLAKRTLSRDEYDGEPVSPIYLHHLRLLVERNPDDLNFLMGLTPSDGSIMCLDCLEELPAGTGEPEENGVDIFGAILQYDQHIGGARHAEARKERLEAASLLAALRLQQEEENWIDIPASGGAEELRVSNISPTSSSGDVGYKRKLSDENSWYYDSDEALTLSPIKRPYIPNPVAGPSYTPYQFDPHWTPTMVYDSPSPPQADRNAVAGPSHSLSYDMGIKMEDMATSVYNAVTSIPGRIVGALPSIATPFEPVYHAPTGGPSYQTINNGPRPGDFKLNYNDNGPIRSIDRGCPDPRESFREFIARANEDFQDAPSVREAMTKLKINNAEDRLPGMEVTLLPHQHIGVSWMIEQENNSRKCGGVLADDMGLGKTVQMIATIVANKPVQGEERKVTLIVAPASLLRQWHDEIQTKTSPGLLKAFIHHGSNKLPSSKDANNYDVIITSYQTLCRDFPRPPQKPKTLFDPAYSESDDEQKDRYQKRLLATIPWLRVVLDEAQVIRNRSTRTSRNVAELDAKYRWALSGTPVTNSLADLYSLLRFCHLRPFNDWTLFNEQIAKVQKRNMERAGRKAQAVMKPHLLRRTKDSKLEGKPIIQLGPKAIEFVYLEFSPQEQEIYQAVEARMQLKVSKFIKAGSVAKNYQFILVMILRLRQIACHPQLIVNQDADVNDPDAVIADLDEKQRELLKATKLMGQKWVDDVKAKFKAEAEERILAEKNEQVIEEEECPICFDAFSESARITACRHKFCAGCLEAHFAQNNLEHPQHAEHELEYERGFRACAVCRTMCDPAKVFLAAAFEPSPPSPAENALDCKVEEFFDLTQDNYDVKGKGKAKAWDNVKVRHNEQANPLEGINLDKLHLGSDFEPSTKMIKMMELLYQWYTEFPEDKVIIYSQWTSMLDMVFQLLGRHGIESVQYDGRMNRVARDEALVRFKKRDGPRIMLISLKCGGVGLNLVEANRVINLDLAWNSATENQAFDRVHRLGQQKPVVVQKLVVKGTIEEKMIRLQNMKQGLADAALGEGKGGKIKRMSVKDIAELFGL